MGEKNENKKVAEKDTKNKKVTEAKKVEYVKKEESKTDLIIDPEVIASIVAMEIDKMQNVDTVGNIFGAFSSKNKANKGIKVELNNDKVKIDVNVNVDYGMRIPDVAFEIQSKLKKQVENMTGFVVNEVNVHVQGIRDPKEQKIEEASRKALDAKE